MTTRDEEPWVITRAIVGHDYRALAERLAAALAALEYVDAYDGWGDFDRNCPSCGVRELTKRAKNYGRHLDDCALAAALTAAREAGLLDERHLTPKA